MLKKDILSFSCYISEHQNPIYSSRISACQSKLDDLVGIDQSGLLKIIELIVHGQKLLTIERLDNTQKAKTLASQINYSDMIKPIMKFGNAEFPGYAISLNVFNPLRKQTRNCLFKVIFVKNESQEYRVHIKWHYTPKLRLLDNSFEWKYTPSCFSATWLGIGYSLLVFLRTLIKKGVAKLPKTACPSVFTLANPKE